jgi:hypothetical protein
MKKAITLLFVALSYVGLVSAQEAATAPPVENPNAPEIKFEQEVHDFGTLKQGAECVQGAFDYSKRNSFLRLYYSYLFKRTYIAW